MNGRACGAGLRGAAAMTNLAEIVQNAREARGEWLAVRQGDLALTYAELADATGQAAAFLREAGVEPGSRVALMLPNVLAYPLFFYGSLRSEERRVGKECRSWGGSDL